jgi:hypothetical protein
MEVFTVVIYEWTNRLVCLSLENVGLVFSSKNRCRFHNLSFSLVLKNGTIKLECCITLE